MRDKDYRIEIDGKLVTLAELKAAYRFWQKYQWDEDTLDCPICGTSLYQAGLFVCAGCGELLTLEEKCREHNEWGDYCKDCCEECQHDKAICDEINNKIDALRGK